MLHESICISHAYIICSKSLGNSWLNILFLYYYHFVSSVYKKELQRIMLRAAARFSFPLWLQVIDEHSVMRLNNGTRAILRIYEVELCGLKIKPWLCSDWMEAVSWLRLMSRTAVKSCIIYCSDQKCGQIKLSCTVVHVCHRLAFVLSWAMPWKRCPGVLRTWNTFLEKKSLPAFWQVPSVYIVILEKTH